MLLWQPSDPSWYFALAVNISNLSMHACRCWLAKAIIQYDKVLSLIQAMTASSAFFCI